MDILLETPNMAWCKPDWGVLTMSNETKDLLKQCINSQQLNLCDDIDEIIERSKKFKIPFPIETVRLETLKLRRPMEKLKRNVVSTYPIIHERVVMLMAHFLTFKREFGSSIEKALYKDMSVIDLIDRILKKRAVMFMKASDDYLLLTGEKGKDGWEAVGTLQEKPPLVMENCLSYDEIKLSALVYVSGYTECINDGLRQNKGVVNEDIAEEDAVIIGLIGSRFKRKFRMEYEDTLITKEQNCTKNGYGMNGSSSKKSKTTDDQSDQVAKMMWRKMWFDFYQVQNYTYEELTSNVNVKKVSKDAYLERYVKLPRDDIIFDNEVFYKRITILAECALIEAEQRAYEAGKYAYLNIIGCGLGVWRVSNHQNDVYVLTFLERIRSFLKKDILNHVTDVNFAYIPTSSAVTDIFSSSTNSIKKNTTIRSRFFESASHPKGGVNVQVEKREPSAKLRGEHAGKLLVLTYAWDGNAHPGNEFWKGSLASSGDPAAASSTQVAELHNAHINPATSGLNARVVGARGVMSIADYCSAVST